MKLILVVHLDPDGQAILRQDKGYYSSDRHSREVKEFCKLAKLPYSDRFVSIAAYAEIIPRTAIGKAYGGPYGKDAILKLAEVIPDIRIICIGDLQTEAKNGLRFKKSPRFKQFEEKFIIPIGSAQDIEKQIYLLARKVRLYAEVRIFRALRISDIVNSDGI